MITPEQRRERQKAKHELKKIFPHASLSGEKVRLHVVAGDKSWLVIRVKDDSGKWIEREVFLGNLVDMSAFLDALIRRYNGFVSEVNDIVTVSGLKSILL